MSKISALHTSAKHRLVTERLLCENFEGTQSALRFLGVRLEHSLAESLCACGCCLPSSASSSSGWHASPGRPRHSLLRKTRRMNRASADCGYEVCVLPTSSASILNGPATLRTAWPACSLCRISSATSFSSPTGPVPQEAGWSNSGWNPHRLNSGSVGMHPFTLTLSGTGSAGSPRAVNRHCWIFCGATGRLVWGWRAGKAGPDGAWIPRSGIMLRVQYTAC